MNLSALIKENKHLQNRFQVYKFEILEFPPIQTKSETKNLLTRISQELHHKLKILIEQYTKLNKPKNINNDLTTHFT